MKGTYTIKEIADFLKAPVHGEASQEKITGISSLKEAVQGDISFLDNASYRKYLIDTKASVIILSAEHADLAKVPVIITKNPYLAYARVATLFNHRPSRPVGIHPTAVIGENCEIHPTASIGPLCVIENNCVIGMGCSLGPRVTLYDGTQLGNNVIIHSGAVLGSDGFGNARDGAVWVKVPQLGRVIVGDNVEIGANTTIDRGALEDTLIEEGVRLDNQIQIAHNVKIGAHTAIAACVGIAGSTTIGKHCLIGGAVGISGHLTIGDGIFITGLSAITKSIHKPGVYSSTLPAQKNQDWLRNMARLRHLDDLFERVKNLEQQIEHNEEENS